MKDWVQNRKFLIGLSLVGLAVALTAGGTLWTLVHPASIATPTPMPTLEVPPELQLTPPPSLEELATRYPQLGDLLHDPALDSIYKDFLLAYQAGGVQAARELALQRGILNKKDEIRITLVIDSEENTQSVTDELKRFGVIIEGSYHELIDIAVPMAFVEGFAQAENPGELFEQLTQLKHVIKLRLPIPTRTSGCKAPGECPAPEGKAEGPGITGAEAWHAAGFRGQGVKIGVLDLGFDGYRDLLGNELPEQLTAKSFVYDQEVDSSGEVHGTACAEIVHAMAPDAELYLAYYSGSEVSMGRAVDWLLEQDVHIISHSATGLAAPMDGSGSQARLVDEVFAQGVIWVNASGNYADEHYRATFTDQDGDGQHEFPNGTQLMTYQPPKQDAMVILNWDDWADSQQDLELYVYDKQSTLIASSQNTQAGQAGDEPFEFIRLRQPGAKLYYLVIQARQITRSVTFDLYAPDGELEFTTAAYSLGTPADAAGSLSVGAIEWHSNGLENFSSQGPTNDERLKPDITAPDDVSTASYAPRSFAGTSASTPHAAGAAALVLNAWPDYNPRQVMDYLIANSQDLGPDGPDAAYGYGRLSLPAPQLNQPPPTPAQIPPTPVAVVPAPITPIPPARTATGNNAPVAILVCLGGLICLGALGSLAGLALLLALTRSTRRAAQPQASYAPQPAQQACLSTSEGTCIALAPGENTLGRSHENDLVLADDDQVSRRHAVIAWDGQRCSVTDLTSSNGTFVNGNRIPPHTPYPLHSGDRLRLGPTAKFVVRLPVP
ncbi:MAG: S8 family serine peptidase [Thermoflexales bacterium]|nr:S8 family serine peptidase [Thermoflexales bacterium]